MKCGDVEEYTGYPEIILELFAHEFDLPVLTTFVVALTLHSGCSYGFVSAMLTGLGHPISKSSISRMMAHARAATEHTWSYKPERRFQLEDALWPHCHGLIDGVPVYCRGTAEYFNDKHGQKSVVFQVVSDMAGRPLSWSRGLPGRRSDAVALDGWSPFMHYDCEFLLADSIYMACAHCITPFKAGVQGNPSDDVCDKFELLHRKIRARIEHLFARVARHRWTRGSDFHTDEIPGLFNVQMHLEARYLDLCPLKYPVNQVKKPVLFTANRKSCDCNFTSLNEIPIPNRDTHQYRDSLVRFQCLETVGIQLINKRSRNSAKAKSKTYVPQTRRETRARHKNANAAIKAAGELASKARVRERKIFYAKKKQAKE